MMGKKFLLHVDHHNIAFVCQKRSVIVFDGTRAKDECTAMNPNLLLSANLSNDNWCSNHGNDTITAFFFSPVWGFVHILI
jgi:hypothetical protein